MPRPRTILFALGGLVGVIIIFVVVVVILVFAGGPNLDAECGDRTIDTSPYSSSGFDDKWDAFDDILSAGGSASETFNDSEITQRADAWLLEENIDELEEVTICLFADGTGEAKGKIDLPVLPGISAKITGTMDLSGPSPRLTITDLDIGSAGFLVDLFGAKNEIEDAINDGLEELSLDNAPYRLAISEGTATISGG